MAGSRIKSNILVMLAIASVQCCQGKSVPSCKQLSVQIMNEGSGKSLKGQNFYYQTDSSDSKIQAGVTRTGFGILMMGPEPITWSYEGPGGEELTLSETVKTEAGCHQILLQRAAPSTQLKATDTGRYTAALTSNPGVKQSLYLYVPNTYPPFLLNTERLQSVSLTEGKPLVLPCLLNDPTMKVTFSKRSGLNEWKEVHNVGTYNPQTGFTIKKPFGSFSSLYGSYKCFTKLHNRNDTIFISVAPEETVL